MNVYAFMKGVYVKWFGPYASEEEAKEAFQRRYGYWPEDALSIEPYVSSR